METMAWADDILEPVGIAAEAKFQPKTEWCIPLAVVRMAMEAVQIQRLLVEATMVLQGLALMILMGH